MIAIRTLLLVCVSMLGACSPQAEEFLPALPGAPVAAPNGYTDFCTRSPVHYSCGSSIEDIALSIHGRAKALFAYQSDAETFDRLEHWHSFYSEFEAGRKFRGDCDDFVLTLMDAAVDLGVPLEQISIVYCRDDLGLPHLVLMLGGLWILDNRQSAPMLRHHIQGYEWLKFMRLDLPSAWTRFQSNSQAGAS